MFKAGKIKTVLWALLGVQLLSVVASLSVFLTPAQAQTDGENIDQLCVPASIDNGDWHQPDGWLKAEIIDRAHIRLTYKTDSNCSGGYVIDNTSFASIIDGVYRDDDTGDDNYDYRVEKVDEESGYLDDNHLRGFNGIADQLEDSFGGRDRMIDINTLKSDYFDEAEFLLSPEEDAISPVNCQGTNANAYLANHDADNEGYYWDCGSISGNGYRVDEVLRTASNVDRFNIVYTYSGSQEDGVLTHVSVGERGTRTFKWCEGNNGGEFRTEDCGGDLFIDASPSQLANLGNRTAELEIGKDGSSDTESVVVAGPEHEASEQAGQEGATLNGDGEVDCRSKGGPLGWLWCVIIDAAIGFIEFVQHDVLEPFLHISPVKTEDSDPQYQLWKIFRNLAYGLLIPMFLIVIISQALSLNLVDAYTIKKVLPRIAVVTIGISLSIYLCAFLVDIFNVLGAGIDGLVKSVLTAGPGFGEITQDSGYFGILLALFGTGAGALWLLAGGGAAVGLIGLFVVLPALLGVVVVFVVLVARQALIVLAVVLSPIALLLAVLPSTEKYFRLWLDTFIKLLLMYPIVILFLSAGTILATILSNSSTGLMGEIAAVFAIVIPLFFIPATFRYAGGAITALGGALANLSGRTKEGIRGDPRNENALRNSFRRNAHENRQEFLKGSAYSAGRYNVRGKTSQAWSRSRAASGLARWLKPTQTAAELKAEAAKSWSLVTGNEDDSQGRAGLFGGVTTFPSAFKAKGWLEEYEPGKYRLTAAGETEQNRRIANGQTGILATGSVLGESRQYDGRSAKNFEVVADYMGATKAKNLQEFEDIRKAIKYNDKLTPSLKGSAAVSYGFASRGGNLAAKHTKFDAPDINDWDPTTNPALNEQMYKQFGGEGASEASIANSAAEFLREFSQQDAYTVGKQTYPSWKYLDVVAQAAYQRDDRGNYTPRARMIQEAAGANGQTVDQMLQQVRDKMTQERFTQGRRDRMAEEMALGAGSDEERTIAHGSSVDAERGVKEFNATVGREMARRGRGVIDPSTGRRRRP